MNSLIKSVKILIKIRILIDIIRIFNQTFFLEWCFDFAKIKIENTYK